LKEGWIKDDVVFNFSWSQEFKADASLNNYLDGLVKVTSFEELRDVEVVDEINSDDEVSEPDSNVS
jgi:hypothetical protein